jgi:hypothetical protein
MTPTLRRRHLLAAGALTLAGCAAPDATRYATERPLLRLEEYFDGRVDAWGLFTDRSGQVVKRFTVAMQCSWQGDQGVLDEDFTYSDGTKQRRIWRVRRLGDGRYSGRADDVVGEAQGQAAGNAIRWTYTLALPVDGRTWHVQMDDWMYLMDESTLLNRTAMSKFGIHLGDVTIAFRKRGRP